jgi:hypothetical protein
MQASITNMNRIFKSALFVVLSITFVFCTQEKEVDQDTLVKVYVDILIAEDTLARNMDSLLIVKESIFENYNITKENYFHTINKYALQKKNWDEFFKKSLDYLDSLQKSSEN